MTARTPIALLGVALLAQGCVIKISTAEDEVLVDETFEGIDSIDDIVAVHLDLGSGGAVVLGGDMDTITVHRELEWTDDPPEVSVEVIDGVLEIRGRCDETDLWCGMDHTIGMPSCIPLIADLGSGGLEVDGLCGGIDADLGSGGLVLDQVAGDLVVSVGSGGVDGTNLAATTFVGDTGSGGMNLEWNTTPQDIDISAGSGGIDLVVPVDDYDLDLDAGSGGIDVTGLTDNDDAPNHIRVSVGSGGVSVTGR
ncbi:MAG: hypothetical protein H6739_13740 [Alphaproteobacteria bacterium]|nr:hypothetical protein [Alphaproteobacteria bacterium]